MTDLHNAPFTRPLWGVLLYKGHWSSNTPVPPPGWRHHRTSWVLVWFSEEISVWAHLHRDTGSYHCFIYTATDRNWDKTQTSNWNYTLSHTCASPAQPGSETTAQTGRENHLFDQSYTSSTQIMSNFTIYYNKMPSDLLKLCRFQKATGAFPQ